jgi:hypothetical protein
MRGRRGPVLALVAVGLGLGVVPSTAEAATANFGLGIVLGTPTGFTLKTRLAESSALQLHFGYGYTPDGARVVADIDYLYHVTGLFPSIEHSLLVAPYFGLGAKFGAADHQNPGLGLRVPLGVSFFLRNGVPLEIFAEVGLGIYVLPSTSPLVDGGLGARWYFF